MSSAVLEPTTDFQKARCAEAAPRPWQTLLLWTMVVVAAGMLWRVARYALNFPLWGDESMLCVNFLHRDYWGLTRQLEHKQIAPLLFLWTELAITRILGTSEAALRLLPFLAGLASPLLFWRLCRRWLPPLEAFLAGALLAVSYFPVRHACEVKPYAGDLFLALSLQAAALAWLRRPQQLRWLGLLSILAPIAILFSYPAAFVGGAVSLVLLAPAWRHSAATRFLFVTFNLLMIGAFLGQYFLIGTQQNDPLFQVYWDEAMPPHTPAGLASWLFWSNVGPVLAYPADGVAPLTALLMLVGAASLWRRKQRSMLALLLIPFALTMLAAVLHKYPYGGSARVAQHLAPAICFLAGVGLGAVLGRFCRTAEIQARWGKVILAGLLVVAGVGLTRDFLKPYKTPKELWSRDLARFLATQTGPDDQIVFLQSWVSHGLEWYLQHYHVEVTCPEPDPRLLDTATRRVWALKFQESQKMDSIVARLAKSSRSWTLVLDQRESVPGDFRGDAVLEVEMCCWSSP